MTVENDIARVIEQERALVFDRFDEDSAFELGRLVRESAKAMGRGVAVGVYLWDRTLFFGATAGATGSNRRWVERKAGLVRLLLKSSYRIVLERGDRPRVLDNWGIDPADYAIAGGAFPITVRGAGVIGAAVASGLDERADHEIVRAAVAQLLGHDAGHLALDPR